MIALAFQQYMHNQPKVLYNPTDEPIEFRAGGSIYIFQPGEHRPIDGFAAHIALEMTHTGLIEYREGVEEQPLQSAAESDLNKLSWVELRMRGAKAGFYKPGMKKDEVIQKLLAHEGKNTA